jgi:hypothetical protein
LFSGRAPMAPRTWPSAGTTSRARFEGGRGAWRVAEEGVWVRKTEERQGGMLGREAAERTKRGRAKKRCRFIERDLQRKPESRETAAKALRECWLQADKEHKYVIKKVFIGSETVCPFHTRSPAISLLRSEALCRFDFLDFPHFSTHPTIMPRHEIKPCVTIRCSPSPQNCGRLSFSP